MKTRKRSTLRGLIMRGEFDDGKGENLMMFM